jgi:hypothetical protein
MPKTTIRYLFLLTIFGVHTHAIIALPAATHIKLNCFSDAAQQYPAKNFSTHQEHNQFFHHSYYLQKNLHKYSAHQLAHYFTRHGYTQERILEQYTLYMNPEFISLIKTFAGYEDHIIALNKNLQHKNGFAKLVGVLNGTHKKGLTKHIALLFEQVECEKKKKACKARINQLRQERIQTTWNGQQKFLHDEVPSWHALRTFYQEHNCGELAHIHRRCDALQNIETHSAIYTSKTYVISSVVTKVLNSCGYDQAMYATCNVLYASKT